MRVEVVGDMQPNPPRGTCSPLVAPTRATRMRVEVVGVGQPNQQ
jgi:hypothetical protein